jgi:hypothetical protein
MAYLAGPVHPAPWLHSVTNTDAGNLAALGDGHALSVDSRFHLKDEVIGKTL